jgi:hypothetical protein
MPIASSNQSASCPQSPRPLQVLSPPELLFSEHDKAVLFAQDNAIERVQTISAKTQRHREILSMACSRHNQLPRRTMPRPMLNQKQCLNTMTFSIKAALMSQNSWTSGDNVAPDCSRHGTYKKPHYRINFTHTYSNDRQLRSYHILLDFNEALFPSHPQFKLNLI